MTETPITNTGRNNRYVGGVCIPPGETRHIDENRLPVRLRTPPPPAIEPPLPDAMNWLLSDPVRDIVSTLPDLTDDDLQQLARLEAESARPRSSLLKALSEEELRRANVKTDAEQEEG